MSSERSSRARTKVDYSKLDNEGRDDLSDEPDLVVKRQRKAPASKKGAKKGGARKQSIIAEDRKQENGETVAYDNDAPAGEA
jgi:hypothetical protein